MKIGDKVRVTKLDHGDLLIKALGIGYKLEVGMIGTVDKFIEKGMYNIRFDEPMINEGSYKDDEDIHCVLLSTRQLELVTE